MSDPVKFQGDFVPLVEKAVRRDGTIQVKVIGEGWGSSGYYGRDVLERDIPKAFPAGTHMMWDHPTMSEAEERPERSLRDLAAVTINDPRWQESGPAGPGMYADARVFSGYQHTIDEIADHIGVSIRGSGKVQQGEAAGKTGPIVEEITDGASVDFVTKPGAGGAITSIFESAPGAEPLPDPEPGEPTPPEAAEESAGGDAGKETNVSELKEVEAARDKAQQELAEAQRQLEQERAEVKKLREKHLLREAADFVAGKVAEAELPEMTTKRIVREVAANPILADGDLDEDAMAEQVEKRVKEAEAEVAAILGYTGRVRGQGFGDNGQNGNVPPIEESQKAIDAALAEIGYGGTQ